MTEPAPNQDNRPGTVTREGGNGADDRPEPLAGSRSLVLVFIVRL